MNAWLELRWPSSHASPTRRRRSATPSSAGQRSLATLTTDNWRSTTTLPNARCASSRSDLKRNHKTIRSSPSDILGRKQRFTPPISKRMPCRARLAPEKSQGKHSLTASRAHLIVTKQAMQSNWPRVQHSREITRIRYRRPTAVAGRCGLRHPRSYRAMPVSSEIVNLLRPRLHAQRYLRST
jgi:hypothetical protein